MAEISRYKHQINECGLQFLVDEAHISEEWLRDTFEVLEVEESKGLVDDSEG